MFLPAVELRHLSKFYREGDGERVVLRDAGATLGLGEIGVLIGRSGSGKSTVLNLISGIDRPSEGTVRVNGTDLTALDEGARTRFRREHIGFIFQFFNLIPLLTVEENLFLPLELLGRADSRGRAHALALLARVGLADRARAYPDRLSGGEQQRVAVARALVHDPALVLADEPTGNLDADAATVVLDLLDGLARELGKTVVMATHSREVIGVADRVFLIQQGQLVEQRGAGRRVRLLWRASRRHLLRHPGQIGLSVLGIALGVAVALSIDLATESARRAFALATEAVTGRATHQIVGGPAGLPEAFYRTLRVDMGVRGAAPVVAFDVAAPDHPGRTFQLLGVDPFAETAFRPHLAGADPLGTLAELVGRPGTALMSGPTARALGLKGGAALSVRVAGQRRSLTLVGTFEPADRLSTRALEGLLVTDIATAQELAGARGRLTRIDLIVGFRAQDRALLERIRTALPPGAELTRAGAQAETAASMTAAFSLNLRALSLLALVVGMFLVYNTMTFSVVQRRDLIGTLRALGVTRGEVFTLVAGEALAVGAVGTLLGIGLGLALAQGLLGLVTRTINDLYFVLSVREVWLTPTAVIKAVGLGMGATLLAALAPAREAAGARPREALLRSLLEAQARRTAPRAALAGLALASLGGLLLLPRGGAVWGFVGLFALLMGAALATPLAASALLRVLELPARRIGGLLGGMAARGIQAALSRTGIAIAALMIAVSATIGVGIMIASFREAVERWLEGTLRADVYVSPPSLIGSRPDATLHAGLAERLAATPGVAAVSTSRGATVASPRGSVHVVALGVAAGRAPSFPMKEGRLERVWAAVEAGAVMISEPFAYRHELHPGRRVHLATDRGPHAFPIAGIFYDYGSSAGVVVMSRATYDRFWDDRAVSAIALYAASGTDPDALIAALRTRAAEATPPAEVVIRSNRALREASLEIFDRTFAVTRVLRVLIVVVAFVGVLSALMAQALERTREVAFQRALGLTPRQVWGVITAQTGLMGLVAGLLALPVGVLLAAVLVFVINRRSFGWTMPLDVRPDVLLQGLLLAVVAALLAGLYPALRMAGASPAEALRDE